MHDYYVNRAHADRVAEARRAQRRIWSRPPRPPSPLRSLLAAALRSAADRLEPAVPARRT